MTRAPGEIIAFKVSLSLRTYAPSDHEIIAPNFTAARNEEKKNRGGGGAHATTSPLRRIIVILTSETSLRCGATATATTTTTTISFPLCSAAISIAFLGVN